MTRKFLACLLSWSLVATSLLVWPGPPPARAAIALSGSVVSGCVSTSTPITLANFPVTIGIPVYVGVFQRNETITDTVSGGGLTWTSRADVDQAQGFIGSALWSTTPTSTTTIDIVISLPSNNAAAYVIAQSVSGVDTATDDGIEALATTIGPAVDDNDMLFPVTTVTANAWALAIGATLNATLTIPGEETDILENTDDACTTFKGHMWAQGPIVTPAATTLGAANDLSANNDWCMIVVALKPAAAAGGGSGRQVGAFLPGI